MHIIEHYKELIDRDPNEISSTWKYLQMFFYFMAAIAGYICSILFYVIWFDICGENCPLWAQLRHRYHTGENLNRENITEKNNERIFFKNTDYNWTLEVSASFSHGNYCKWFYVLCLLSCFFGVVWIAMFFMCGKGGYDTRMYTAAWRIITPALIFNIIFTIIILSATGSMRSGMSHFVDNVDEMANNIRTEHFYMNHSKCENLKDFIGIHSLRSHDVCKYMIAIDYGSWLMMIGWIGGTVLLILRVINVEDFRMLNVTIFQMTPEIFEQHTLKRVHVERVEAPIPMKKIKLIHILCCCCKTEGGEEEQ